MAFTVFKCRIDHIVGQPVLHGQALESFAVVANYASPRSAKPHAPFAVDLDLAHHGADIQVFGVKAMVD